MRLRWTATRVRLASRSDRAGTDLERLFSFAAAFCDALPREAAPALDPAYRAFLWRMWMRDGRLQLGVHAAKAADEECGAARRQSILQKGRARATRAPAPLPEAARAQPLDALVREHGASLRVYMDADAVRRVLTGTDAPFPSPAAYAALQLVCRARGAGETVVGLGRALAYDQKTVYYLVKQLVDRGLVAKFAAPEMGHVSNYVVARRYLAENPQWRAQHASGEVGEPAWVDAWDEGESDDAEPESEAPPAPGPALPLPPPHPRDAVLAYPLLSAEQSNVWLHSRQDLLSARLSRLLAASPAHMVPRQQLAARLGVRASPALRRPFLAFVQRHVAAGHMERVRVQFPGAARLYVRATAAGLANACRLSGEPAAPPDTTPRTWTATVEVPLERQLLARVEASGARGCTLHELAAHFHVAGEARRLVEQVLSRQVGTGAPPYAATALCAPYEQAGRERRIRYYTYAGFAARCAAEGLDVAAALGHAACGRAAPPAVPVLLPGEALSPGAAALDAALDGVAQRACGFFREVAGPVPFAHARAPLKRGRPRKDEGPAKRARTRETVAAVQHAPAPAADPPARRTNLSAFHRSTLLANVLRHVGGACDEADVPRRTREYVAAGGDGGGGDLLDRTTRAKAIRHAVERKLVQSVKVPRAGDAQRPRTVLYLADMPRDALQAHLRGDAAPRETRGVVALSDVAAEHVGLDARWPRAAPWADAAPVVPGGADPLDDPATRLAFAQQSHVLRQYYGFAHGAAARLREFHRAAVVAADRDGVFSLAWFSTACPLRTLATLVPVKLRSGAAVRAVTADYAATPVAAVPPRVAARLGLQRAAALHARLASYARQLEALELATPAGAHAWRLARSARGRAVATDGDVTELWAALQRELVGRSAPLAFLASAHAWTDTFTLRRPQRLFLRRYADPSPEVVDRLAHAVFAPRDAVAAFYARAPSARETRAILRAKVADRRAQREDAWAAATADVPAHLRTAPRLAQLHRRFVRGREALAPAELPARIRAALGSRRLVRADGGGAARRRAKRPPWSAAQQALLRDAYVVLAARHRAWAAALEARGAPPAAPDWSALAQLAEAPDAVPVWRARLRQLMASPREQAHTAVLIRAWSALAARARADGTLADDAWPQPAALDLAAHVAYFRAHVDQAALLAEHAAAARRVVLPRVVTRAYAARWAPLVRRAPLPSDAAPLVHRLAALRARAHSLGPAAGAAARGAAPLDGVYEGAVKMLLATDAARVPLAADAADVLHAWSASLGADEMDAAIARLVARRVVRAAERAAPTHLAYTEEHARAAQAPLAPQLMRDACAAAPGVAHPAATDGETAAWISMLDAGAVRATLDMAPLHALRRRTQLNARTLEDVETECVVRLDGDAAAWAALVSPAPRPAPPSAAPARDAALERRLRDAGAAGVPVGALDMPRDELAAALRAAGALVTGYDVPRAVHAAHAGAWRVTTLAGASVAPRAWLDAYGDELPSVWSQRVALVVAWVCTRPGLSLAQLHAQVAAALDLCELRELVAAAERRGLVRVAAAHWALCAPGDVPLLPGATPWFAAAPAARDA